MKQYFKTKKLPNYINDILDEYTEKMIKLANKYDVMRTSELGNIDPEETWSIDFLEDAKKRHRNTYNCYTPEVQVLFDYNHQNRKSSSDVDFKDLIEFKSRLTYETGMRRDPLSAFYPKGGGLSWHNNADVPGNNILFTYSQNGDGFFRYERDGKIITVEDTKGWNVKFMYYGSVLEESDICWHTCASYDDSRMTFAFLTDDVVIKDFMADCELEEF